MNTDQAYKQFLMEQARKHFEKVSEAVAEALCEHDKELTLRQYDPRRLRERIGKN